MSRSRFSQYAWGVLAYCLAVILWGAFVRATVSGDGCGPHWPLCNGEVIPSLARSKTLIEFAHRLSSGLMLPMVLLLIAQSFRLFPREHPVRAGALLSLFFTCTEALLGMILVKYKLVAHNDSVFRAIAMSAHLVNTLLLLGSLTLTAWWASGQTGLRWRGQGAIGYGVLFGLGGMLLLAVSGAISALGATLFPGGSHLEGLARDFAPTAHFLERLRLWHPLIAASVGVYLLSITGLLHHARPSASVQRFARWMGGTFLAALVIGAVNYLLHAPIAMQLIHLAMADALWLLFVLLAASAMAADAPHVALGRHDEAVVETSAAHAGIGAATWRDYLALTKPRVISLLLFTTLATMFIAQGRWPGGLLLLAVAVGGYMAAGSANAINMVIDRDIDGRMHRTTGRPTVTQKISSRSALLFASILEFLSFTLLWGAANLLTALLALAGLLFYIIIYTLLLKRRTWHNIVIGGAAGAFPPLVGWAAVTGDLSPLAWYLFAIIFVWTPVHFWALALLLKDDYASAGIPMLPVVRGERVTVIQIGLYAILTAIVSILPLLQRQVGVIYFVAAMLLNAALLLRCLRLYQRAERPQASSLFHYSMVYLALLFLMMAVDRTFRL